MIRIDVRRFYREMTSVDFGQLRMENVSQPALGKFQFMAIWPVKASWVWNR